MKPLLVLAWLLVAPVTAYAQSFAWEWEALSRTYMGDPATWEAQFLLDGGTADAAYFPAGPATCLADLLTCSWTATGAAAERLAVPGVHRVELVIQTPGGPGVAGAGFLVVPGAASVPPTVPQPCPYTPPGGVLSERPIGHEIRGSILKPVGPRLARLKGDGWDEIISSVEGPTTLLVWMVCVGVR